MLITRNLINRLRVGMLISVLFSWLLSASALAGTYQSTGNGNYHTAGSWVLVAGAGGPIPGNADTATILAGHTLVANAAININSLTIQNGANLTLGPGGSNLQANTINVLGTLQGFDNGGGMGGSVHITNMGAGFALNNQGTIRGGHPGGSLFISSANGSDLPCNSNGSSVTGINGQFLGGNDFGSVYIVSETITMTSSQILGGSGFAPNMASGPVYIGGINVTLDGNTQVSSGSNGAASGTAGSVKIVASNCNGGLGNLFIGPNVNVTVGAPVVSGCPGVLLYAGGTSTVLGTVGPMGGSSCIYWDPPALELAGDAHMSATNIEVAGESLTAGNLNPGAVALEAQQRLTISVDVLDLTGLTPSSPYFTAGHEIIINAHEIMLDPNTELEQFMEPAPFVQQETRVQRMSVTPGITTTVSQGANPAVAIQAVSVGNTDIDKVVIKISDSKGWLSGGGYYYAGPLAAGESKNYQAVINVPAGTAPGTSTQLHITVSHPGEPDITEISTFIVEEY